MAYEESNRVVGYSSKGDYMKRGTKILILTLAVVVVTMTVIILAVFAGRGSSGSTEAAVKSSSESAMESSSKTNSKVSDITVKQKAFGTWIKSEKYYSYNYIARNMAGGSLLTFGSSEFNHGGNTRYFPKKMFAKTNENLMMIGNAFNQTLSMATYLGALEPKMGNRKVVLFLSPSWFYKGGVSQKFYTMRFSELMYIKFMENGDVPASSKKYLARRSVKLINDRNVLARVKRYNKVFISGSDSAADKAYIAKRLKTLNVAADKSASYALRLSGISTMSDKKFSYDSGYEPAWSKLMASAVKADKGKRYNRYYIDDERYRDKYAARVASVKGGQKHTTFDKSPEYADLRCFLDICKANDIKVLLIDLPMNGYWYDMTGLNADKRLTFVKKVDKIAADYDGCQVVKYTKQEYSKYFLLDTVHLSGKGWTMVNKDIYDFDMEK